ncbi:CDP-alcohol phosphatidyltransferase family protein [Clostridium algidicarnis]|uniref:CDP-alcohol phosphatidyltransferase family protein n=1 Tax=Clostridium algidicarnis TaxID=37659 RepID=A0ABS6BZJ7_9CLOT|nr:CDP-alcohol phosphatidyltransferase family protein [Clostridium algidicarnis]MBB6696300.1 CDP-alcohol phosphatidyltransferase family protein [Clostridium algidicarnis]MBU3203075.1 CDP-alcohol phosphatidyltransferase family protein [Clostridium algidicarnis]MBU3205627.1 CDP-alcohol phosphatidyltransferase family protein [Clostridium algidicarnis]MBU3211229.1 CDP-alcohol phosphatidyltransferase family protein [Clostridium algidicarnis]MBU3218664.1 CDP-alcohol phosphatidyltransferase family pr
MLDTYGRKYVNPLINLVAKFLLNINLTPNNITLIAFIIGIASSVFIYFDLPIVAIFALWFSGFLDAVDGAMARKKGITTSIGTLMDITFDRMVEMGIILTLAIKFPNDILHLLILTICILISMTLFLTVAALTEKKGMKSFYYQAGFAERTEGFIMFSLMINFSHNLVFITDIFSLAVIITAFQRFLEAKRILK